MHGSAGAGTVKTHKSGSRDALQAARSSFPRRLLRESLYVIAGPAVFLGVLYALLFESARFPTSAPEIPFSVYEFLAYVVTGSVLFRVVFLILGKRESQIFRYGRYVMKKVLTYLIVLFVTSLVVFIILMAVFVFRDPIPIQSWRPTVGNLLIWYIEYVEAFFVNFDFGPSRLGAGTPALTLIMRALPWSIMLLGISSVLAWIVGLIVGTFVGWKRGTKLDNVALTISLFASQIPYYLLALFLLMVFAYTLGWFPTRWPYSPLLKPALDLEFILNMLYHSVLPAFSLILVALPAWIITTRAWTITILGEDYMLFAQAKGLKKWRIINRYALRNVLLPQVTALGISLGAALNGFYLVEWFFSYPGIGKLLLEAFKIRDFSTTLGLIVISISTVVLANLVIDLLYPLIDPRITHGEG
ncbi:MAG: ABC transporter permease [Candidatus Bathyarchaeota archaeon]|nr:ABC transporter permease [Candidatus Bathyarchaeota archaeon]